MTTGTKQGVLAAGSWALALARHCFPSEVLTRLVEAYAEKLVDGAMEDLVAAVEVETD